MNNTEDNSRASTSSESQERTSVFDSELQTKKSQYAVTRMTNTTTTTNVFYFVFESRLNDALPQIMPETYGESLLYIDGERCLNKMLDRHASSYSINSHVAS